MGALGWKLHKANASTRGPNAHLGLPSKLRPKPPSSHRGQSPALTPPCLQEGGPAHAPAGRGRGFPSAQLLPLAQGHGQQQPTVTAPQHHHCPELFQRRAPSPSPQHRIPSHPSPRRVGQAACGARTASGLKPLLFHAFSASNFFFQYVLRNPSKSSQHSSGGTQTGTSVEAAPGSRRVHRSRTLGPPASRISLHFLSPTPPLPSLLFGFTYPAEDKKSQVFLLLHLDSVSFISHKHICRFLRFFICSLRLQ